MIIAIKKYLLKTAPGMMARYVHADYSWHSDTETVA